MEPAVEGILAVTSGEDGAAKASMRVRGCPYSTTRDTLWKLQSREGIAVYVTKPSAIHYGPTQDLRDRIEAKGSFRGSKQKVGL